MTDTPLLINTRPSHRSDAISALGGLGIDVLNLPLLTIDDLPLSEADIATIQALIHGDGYRALIVTSVESAKRAIRYLGQLGIHHANDAPSLSRLPIIAVGTATQETLSTFGLSVILPDTHNNEGMLKIDAIQALQSGDKILIWRGVGGRRLLHDTLIARGVQIDVIEWYERTQPHDLLDNYHHLAPRIHQALTDGLPVFVLVASQMAFEHWQTLNDPHAEELHYLTLGDRLFDIVRQAHPKAHIIDNLSATHIQATIERIHSH